MKRSDNYQETANENDSRNFGDRHRERAREIYEMRRKGMRQNYRMQRARVSVVPRVFWGTIFFLLAAVGVFGLFVINSHGAWPGFLKLGGNSVDQLLDKFWLIMGAVVLIAIALASLVSLNWFGFFIPIAIIIAMFSSWLGIASPAIPPLIFIIAVLLSISFTILFHRNWRKHYYAKFARRDPDFANFMKRDPDFANFHQSNTNFSQRFFGDMDSFVTGNEDGGEVYIFAKFSEGVRYIDNKNLRKVFIDARLGAVKSYFQNAKLADNKLDININAKLGSVELYVPRNWKLISKVNTFAGGISENGYAEVDENSPIVTLRGSARMGAITVNYV